MYGIKAAFTGRLGRPAERKTTDAGKRYVRLSVAVDLEDRDEPAQWINVMAFLKNQEDLEELADRADKGNRVYVEGRLKAGVWTPDTGEPRPDVTVFAWRCFVMGSIGMPSERRNASSNWAPPRGEAAPPPEDGAPPPDDSHLY